MHVYWSNSKRFNFSFMHRFCLLYAFLLIVFPILAQRNEIFNSRIASLQVIAGNDWLSMPIIELNGGAPVRIAFDDLTHEYHRYVYKIEHCEADWTTSEELFSSDYCDGFTEGNVIEDTQESFNTNVLYTHYAFQIPNSRCRLKLSGNYKVTVYDENDDNDPILTACFMVVDPQMAVSLEATSNTDVDINGSHQQISMRLNYGNFHVTDYTQQIKTVVLQNQRWDNAVINAKPQFVMSDGLKWDHNKSLLFDAGNEYRKFEALDVTHTTMGLESMVWDGSQYHAYIWTDEPRRNYVHDEDADGAFYIRNSDNQDIENTCEYMLVHFRLKSPLLNGDVYVNGVWTNDDFIPEDKMEFNETTHQYEAAILLKQGYYSYQYLLMNNDGTLTQVPSEGNFYQTENSYQALVYYKGPGERTDQLVAYQQVKFN
jgi:hypothetical protein